MNIDMNVLIWIAIFLLGYFTIYLVIERVLYLAPRREADELELNRLMASWRRDRQVSSPKQLGWLGWLDRLLARTCQNTADVWQACSQESRDVARYDKALPVIASLGTALGLLGTFLALKQNAVGAADPTQVIALGIGTSIYGLVIAIAATFGDWLVRVPHLPSSVPNCRGHGDVGGDPRPSRLTSGRCGASEARTTRRRFGGHQVNGRDNPIRGNCTNVPSSSWQACTANRRKPQGTLFNSEENVPMRRTALHYNDNPAELQFPASGIDIFATLLLVVMVNHPAFCVNRDKLPTLQPKSAASTRPADGRSGYRIELKSDGTVNYEGKPVILDGLARRIASEPSRDRPIQVSLETTPDGRGAMEAWLRLQTDLTEAKLWNRVQVLTRFKQSKSGRENSLP